MLTNEWDNVYLDSKESNCFLLELTDDLLDKELVIRGSPEDDAVVCTADKTFRLRSVHTSNTQLVVHAGTTRHHGSNYYEMVASKGNTCRIAEMLSMYPYHGPDVIDTIPDGILTWHSLRDSIPADEAEIRMALKDAVLLDGAYRKLAPQYIARFLDIFATLVTTEAWSVSGIAVGIVKEAIAQQFGDEFSPEVLDHMLRSFGQVDKQVWSLDETRVAEFYAHELFRSQRARHVLQFTLPRSGRLDSLRSSGGRFAPNLSSRALRC